MIAGPVIPIVVLVIAIVIILLVWRLRTEMKDILCNDKFLVTFAVMVLGILYIIYGYLSMFSPENVITAIVSGLFGMAAGRGMARADDRTPTQTAKETVKEAP